MSQSQIFMENNIYMAMMDIKVDIEKLKVNHKEIRDQIKKCHHLCSKTQVKSEQQFQEITKIVTNSFLELTAHNSLKQKQNKIYEDLLASNQKLVEDTKFEYNRLVGIFDKQKQQIERVLKANQLIVNEQLTAICKQQESKIEQQISEFNRQNQFIEEQKLKIQLAFEAVANFQQRNRDLEKKLLEQKKQIEQFIAEATQKNADLVEKFIYAKAEEANGIYQQQIRTIQGIKNQFERSKNECLVNIDEKIRRGDENMSKQLRYAEEIKSETNKLKCQCQGYYYQQKRMVDRANQQFKRIEHMKQTIRKEQKEYENKFEGMKKEINRIQDQHNSHFEVKWRDIDTKINRCDDKCNNSQKIVNQFSMQINDVKRKVEIIQDIRRQIGTIKSSQDSSTNKVSGLQNSVRTIEDRLRKVEERSRSHSRHRHKGAQ